MNLVNKQLNIVFNVFFVDCEPYFPFIKKNLE